MEMDELSDSGAGDACHRRIGIEQDGLNATQPLVEIVLYAFVLEVGDASHTLDDVACTDALCQIDGEVGVARHFDARIVSIELTDGSDAFFEGEHTLFAGVVTHADDKSVEEVDSTPHDIIVPDSERIERSYE